MSREYITKEFQAIANDKSLEAPLNLAMASAWVLGNFKGINLKVLDLRNVAGITDFFVLASATNSTQSSAMAEEVSHQMRELGNEAISREGLKTSTDWILLDYGDIIVHVFSEGARSAYDLDNLYKRAINVEIPESYYFSTPKDVSSSSNGDGRSFF